MFLTAAALATGAARANVLFLEPLDLALGGSDENEVRGKVGGPCQRTVLADRRIELTCSRPFDRELRAVRATLAPSPNGTPRLDQVELDYHAPRRITTLRARYDLTPVSWVDTETIEGRRCKVQYHLRVSLQTLQSASLGIAVCPDGTVPFMRYLSPHAFSELGKRRAADAPDKTLRAEIRGDDAEGDSVVVRDASGRLVYQEKSSQRAAITIERIEWTPDSHFLVWSGAFAGGHQPWHHPIFFWSRSTKSVQALDDYLPGAVADARFSLSAPAFIDGTQQLRAADHAQAFRLNLGALAPSDLVTDRRTLPTGLDPRPGK